MINVGARTQALSNSKACTLNQSVALRVLFLTQRCLGGLGVLWT